MKKFLVLALLAVPMFLSGCGISIPLYCGGKECDDWIAYSEYGNPYHPVSVLAVQNTTAGEQCYLEVVKNGVVAIPEIRKGKYSKVKISVSYHDGNLKASILVNKYCKRGQNVELVNSRQKDFYADSRQFATATWIVSDRWFKEREGWGF